METTVFSIDNNEYGTVYFAKRGRKIFVILRELCRCFGYDCIQCPKNETGRKIPEIITYLDLSETSYFKFMKLINKRLSRSRFIRVHCVEINEFVNYLSIARGRSSNRLVVLTFLKNNSKLIDMRNDSQECMNLIKYANENNQDLFQDVQNDISALQNKFKAMQVNLDSQKQQIEAKDKSIFVLRAKIKELEEQNADLKSQIEKQSTVNERFCAFVQSWNSVNNAV